MEPGKGTSRKKQERIEQVANSSLSKNFVLGTWDNESMSGACFNFVLLEYGNGECGEKAMKVFLFCSSRLISYTELDSRILSETKVIEEQ
ncbi:unnamed protein product [Linum trigynum]|uniref:Uncharacterized protein n=1 Tax=Linum trigynum TaxID=586398 RepID=A0AAV2FP43_9ROSI